MRTVGVADGFAWDLNTAVKRTKDILAGSKKARSDACPGLLPTMSYSEILKNEEVLFERLGIDSGSEGSLPAQIPMIDPETEREIGAEISTGRILQRRSSTALAVNFFDPWRSQPELLGEAFGAPWAENLSFEQKFPTELSDKPQRSASGELVDRSPTLDVVLEGGDLPTIAIEAKFTEPYFSRPSNRFSASYFRMDNGFFKQRTERLWDGLPGLRDFAQGLESGQVTYQFLHAAQLIKHALGLRRHCGRDGFWLNYVWFDGGDDVSRIHRREIEHFLLIASDDIHIGAISYQDLLAALSPNVTPEYVDYLTTRYFDPVEHTKDPDRNLVLPAFAAPRNEIPADRVIVGQATDSFGRLSPSTVIAEVMSTMRQAPHRSEVGKRYFVKGHDCRVGAPKEGTPETHLQRAMVGKTLRFAGSPSVRLLDYEVPTKAFQTDKKLGEADLFGIEDSARHVIVELKVNRDGANDSPLRALIECLTYSAVLAANKSTIDEELRDDDRGFGTSGNPDESPADQRLIIAAPTAYWERLDAESDWLSTAGRVIQPIAKAIGASIEFVDLGAVSVDDYEKADDETERVKPLLFVDGIQESADIQATILAQWPSK